MGLNKAEQERKQEEEEYLIGLKDQKKVYDLIITNHLLFLLPQALFIFSSKKNLIAYG